MTMLGIRNRAILGTTLLATWFGVSLTAHAQFGNPCNPCAQQSYAAVPIVQAPVAYANPCPCMQPVQETVYQDVQQVQYRPVKKTVKQPKVVTVMEERDVVQYKQVMEARTVNVPSYTTQTYTECRPVTQNRSYWQSRMVPVQKPSPCQYDPRTGFLGEMNRMGLALRNSFTPNYTMRRQFVPNVTSYNVPVQRTVQIPTTRQVTYNVARMVPETVKQKVAVQKTIWEDTEVTAYEPYTTTKRVAVGTRTRMAYVDPTGASTATAAEPTPATTAEGNEKGTTRFNSAPRQQVPVRQPTYNANPTPQPRAVQPQPARGPVATVKQPSVIKVAGWKATAPERAKPTTLQGPTLSVAAK